MIIDPKATLAGAPILEVRELLRKHHTFGFVEEHIEAAFPGAGRTMLAALIEEGYVAPSETPEVYTTTLKGGALVRSSAARPVARATAERCLREFLERVREVRGSPEFLWKVKRVILFGSLLTGHADKVGDVDLAVELTPKEKDAKVRTALERAHTEKALQAGRRFSNFVEQIGYPQTQVRVFLKGRSRVLQLTDCDDGVLESATQKLIYADSEE